MGLLFVIKTLSLSGGGAERVLAEVTSGLASRGHEVTVVTYDLPEARDFYSLNANVRRVRLGIGSSHTRSGVVQTLQQIRALRRVATRAAPDVAIGFMHSAYIPLGLALKGTGIPMIASEHTVHSHYAERLIERLLLSMVPRLAVVITDISEEARDSFPKGVRLETRIMPNPVGTVGNKRASPAAEGTKTLLAVGGLREEKGHRVLISAFTRIATDFPDWRLRIVGEGPLRRELEAQIRASGFAERIALPGATPDVSTDYLRAQLFVMPSSYESFGLATAEALAHGLPTVGFADCPGTNKLIIHGENGLLVAGSEREEALAAGLAELMACDKRRLKMGEAAPARLVGYSPEMAVGRWEELVREFSRSDNGSKVNAG